MWYIILFKVLFNYTVQPAIIKGGDFRDHRGIMRFVNDFDLQEIRRMYIIEHPDTAVIRAWQAHKIEQKWLYVLEGAFQVQLIQPDNWENPSENLPVQSWQLSSENNEVLHIPGGYANGFKALKENSKLLVFSSLDIKEAASDNFRFDKDYWKVW